MFCFSLIFCNKIFLYKKKKKKLKLGRIESNTDGSARPDDAPNVPLKDGTTPMDDVNQVCAEVSTVSNKSIPCAQGIAELIQDLPIVNNFSGDEEYFSCDEYI